MVDTWSPQEDEMLAELLVKQRYSAGLTANHLNKAFPKRERSTKLFTRNSVIGRAHRLGLGGRKPPDPRHEKGQRLPQTKPSTPSVPAITKNQESLYMPKEQKILVVDNTCQFIAGTDLKKCGAPCRNNSNWCEEHHRRMYVSPPARTKDVKPYVNVRKW